ARGPYFAAAPTTELVSWMASAAHNPNCVWVSLKAAPMAGKISSAMELRTNTVPSETAISSSVAWQMGPTAAIALPPQIAVPVEIRKAEVLCIPKKTPKAMPTSMEKLMLSMVETNPLRPALTTWWRYIPKPNPTTDAC